MESHLPLDSPLGGVYRFGGALMGLILIVVGILGFLSGADFITTQGENVLGLRASGLSSLIWLVLGLVLIGAAAVGGNVSAATNTWAGTLLLVIGLVNLAVLRTDANFLAFRMTNVIFCFVVGVALLTCGLYGRVSTGDPHDTRSELKDSGPIKSSTEGGNVDPS